MAKNTIKLNEEQIREMIKESVKRVLNEAKTDYLDSGLDDYRGTGSEESEERMRKIKDKRLGSYCANFRNPGKCGANKSSYDLAIDSYGGRNSKCQYQVFDSFIQPLLDKMKELKETGDVEAYEKLSSLCNKLYRTYRDWASENKGK